VFHRTLALWVIVLAACPALAENWPGWRGRDGTGISQELDLPLSWSATENVRWKVSVPGAGVSAPIVWGDRVYLTSSDGRDNRRLHLLCWHRDTGKLLWQVKLFGSAVSEGQFQPGGMAVPTPVTDGERVFALFGTGDLVCFDDDGKPVWLRSLAQEFGPFRNRWGMASSPVLVDDLLLVQVDHFGPSYLLAVDARTGQDRWRTPRDTTVNWTSPFVVSHRGKKQILTVGTYRLIAYDLEEGKELWSLAGMQNQCILTPLARDDLIFASAGFNFYTQALRLGEPGKRPETVWKVATRGGNISSPICVGDYYYYAEDSLWGNCLSAKSGKRLWRQRLGRQFRASLVAGAGRVYFTSSEGVTTVVKVGPTFERLARNDLGEDVVASPALSQGLLFLRTAGHLYCIGK
jgi:outer membrane protein assembly factor BamB